MNSYLSKLNFPKLSKRKLLFAVLGFSLIFTFYYNPSFLSNRNVACAENAVVLDKIPVGQIKEMQASGRLITIENSYSSSAAGYQIYRDVESNTYYRQATSYSGIGNEDFLRPLDQTEMTALSSNIQKSKSITEKSQYESCGIDVFCYLRNFTIWIGNGILWLFSWLVWLSAQILDISVNLPQLMGGFTTSPIVIIGWPIIRDLANMFFALILLVISFATILRIETYGMKQVLWRLVVAALLINFSLVIAGVIIDGSNVLTNFFIRGNFTLQSGEKADISAAIYNGLKLQNLYNTDIKNVADQSSTPIGGGDAKVNSQLKILLNILLGSVFMIVTSFVLFAAAILFIIRMIALWILLIFAPLAWLAMILPATRSLWSKWWHEFTKWIIFAPVYAFFIYLTVAVINKNILAKTLEQGQAAYTDNGLAITSFLGSNIGFVANYIILIIFMLAGLIFARQSGIAGANTVTSMGKAYGRFFSRWAARGGKVPGATWAAQKLGVTQKLDQWEKGSGFTKGLANVLRGADRVKSTAFTAMSPQVWSRYWAYREQRANAASFDTGAGRINDFATGFTGAIKNFRSASGAKQEQIAKEEAYKIHEARMRGDQTYEGQDISGPTIDAMLHARGIAPGTPQAEEFMRQHDWEQAQKIAKKKIMAGGAVAGLGATFEGMFGKGRLEQIAESREVSRRQQEFGQTLKDEDQIVDYYMKAKDPVDREALFRLIASINGLNTLFSRIKTDFNPKNLSQYMQQNFRGGRGEVLAADVSAMASQSGNFSFVGTTAWDAGQGKIRFATEAEQKATAVKKALEMEGQAWARLTHPDSWIDRDATGRPAKISDFSKEMLNQMTGAHIKQIDRFQGRTLTALYNFRGDFRNYINTTLSGQQQQIANTFIDAIENRYTKAT